MRAAKLAAPRCASVGVRDPRVASLTATPAAVLDAAAAKREGAEKRQRVYCVRFGRGGRAGEGAFKTALGAREKLQKRQRGECSAPLHPPKQRTAAAPTLGQPRLPLVLLAPLLRGDGAGALRLRQARVLGVLVVRCIKGGRGEAFKSVL